QLHLRVRSRPPDLPRPPALLGRRVPPPPHLQRLHRQQQPRHRQPNPKTHLRLRPVKTFPTGLRSPQKAALTPKRLHSPPKSCSHPKQLSSFAQRRICFCSFSFSFAVAVAVALALAV